MIHTSRVMCYSLAQDNDVWSKDQIGQDGVEPSINDDLVGNSNLQANVRDSVKYICILN